MPGDRGGESGQITTIDVEENCAGKNVKGRCQNDRVKLEIFVNEKGNDDQSDRADTRVADPPEPSHLQSEATS